MTADGPKLLSVILTENKGVVDQELVQRYIDRCTSLLSREERTPEHNLFIKDTLETVKIIHARKGEETITLASRAPQTSIRLNELVIKPEIFDGEKPKPRRWLADYLEAIVANNWSDYIAIKYLPTFLTRSAKDWYFTDVRPWLNNTTTWKDVRRAFERNYIGERDYQELSNALENTKQRQNESVSTFIPRVVRMLNMLSPTLPELEILRQIRTKLRPEYKPWLAFENPSNIDSLRQTCLKVEAGLQQLKITNNKDEEKPQQKQSKWNKKPNKTSKRPANKGSAVDKTQKKESSKKPGQTEVCYRCDRPGHLSKDCWAKTKKDGSIIQSPSTSNKVNAVQETNSSSGWNDWGTASPEKVLTIKHKSEKASKNTISLVVGGKKGRLLQTKIICNGYPVLATVDTGAFATVVDESIAINQKWKPYKISENLVGANGNKLDTIGIVSLEMTIQIGSVSKTKLQDVVIVKDLCAPMLLGLDQMRKMQICIDTEQDRLYFQKNSILPGIRTLKDETIPPRSQSVIGGQVNAEGSILAIPFNGRSELIIANVISPVRDNIAPILVLNPGERPVEVKKGTQLAGFEKLENENTPKNREPIQTVIALQGTNETVQVGTGLEDDQINDLQGLINKYKEAFSINGQIGCTNVHKHRIELTENAKPFAEPLRRRAQIQIDETKRQIKEMLRDGIIEESNSPWASAYVLAKKKNGEYRLCVDFRKLNDITKKTVYPLPLIDHCLETLSGKKYFSQIDFASGFWQIEMEEKSKELTAFRTEDGLFQFKRMPFGLTNAPASFQKTINMILAGLKGLNLQVFIDDVCVATETWHEHLEILAKVFQTIISSKMKIKASKCIFGAESITFLGHQISEEGIKQDPEKLKALLKLPYPKDPKGVRRTMGMFSYYRKFVPNFASISEPLTKLTRKGITFQWGEEQKKAFHTIIQELAKNATLAHFNHTDPIQVRTDASKQGVAGILLQKQNDDWKLVSCCSRRLTASESNYGITDLEGLAIVYSIGKFRPYLLGKPFTILTDHCALCALNNKMPNSSRLRRWAIVLSEYDFKIVYTKGKLHSDVDCLSRAPIEDEVDDYLENKVYAITLPLDMLGWKSAYNDQESHDLIQKAFDKEEGMKIIHDIIYKDDLLYVPTSKRDEVVRGIHEANFNAHPGIDATLAKIRETYWWPNMRKEVEQVVKTCTTCILNKPERTKPAGTMYSFEIYEPAKCLAVDCLGPITESLNGNKHVIVSIDMFTRYVDAKAVPDVSAPTFALFLNEHIGRFGVPEKLLTDQGTTFKNEFLSEICKVFGIEHLKATPKHSQGNAVAERVIQTLQEKLRLVLDSPIQEANWDSVLPVAVLAINTSYHTSIGCTPYEMTFGKRAPYQDKNVTKNVTPHDMHAQLIKKYLKECHSTAIAIQSASQERSKRYYEDRHKTKLFDIDDQVVVKSPDRQSKLAPRFKGPYKVVGINKDIYKLEKESDGKITTRHVSDIKHYKTTMNLVRTQAIPIYLILCTLMLTTLAQITYDRVRPVIWLAKRQKVQTGVALYDINFSFTNPCDLWDNTLKKHPEMNGEQSPKDELKIQLESDTMARSEEFHKQCTQLYEKEFIARIDELIQLTVVKRRIPFHLDEEHDTVYDIGRAGRSIQDEAEITNKTNSSIPTEPPHKTYKVTKDPDNGIRLFHTALAEPLSLRRKRGVITDIALQVLGQAASQATSIFISNVVTNLVGTAIERFIPTSNYNRIGRLESAMANMKANFDLTNEVLKGTIQQVEALSQVVRDTIKRFDNLQRDFPHFTWVSGIIINKIMTAGADLERLLISARQGHMDTDVLARMLSLPEVRLAGTEDTIFHSITKLNYGTGVHINFTSRIFSTDTHVYEAYGFSHWENLTEIPEFMEYTGAKRLIYNETSNCIKAIEITDDPVVYDECTELDGEDLALSRWQTSIETRDIYKYADRSTVKKTLEYNYIYCFPGNITIGDKTHRCPIEVFRLPVSKKFKTIDHRHVPSRIQLNVTNREMAIDDVHVGHFDDDSDVLNELRMFDKLTELQQKLEKINNETFVVYKSTSYWTIFITILFVSIAGPLAYYLVVWYCSYRTLGSRIPTSEPNTYEMAQRRFERESLNQTTNMVSSPFNPTYEDLSFRRFSTTMSPSS